MQVSPKIMGLGTIAMISTLLCLGTVRSAHGNYICDYYDCGMGTCTDSSDIPFFMCQCEYGWRRPYTYGFPVPYLPCVIPNCTLSYSCIDNFYPPSPSQAYHGDLSPCEYDVCGAGRCVNASQGGHTCLCNDGFQNLMNSTIGYCVTECQLGPDCAKEGVTIDGSSSKTGTAPGGSTNVQPLDSPTASGSSISVCARLARDHARPLIAKLFITVATVFVVGWNFELLRTFHFPAEVWNLINLLG